MVQIDPHAQSALSFCGIDFPGQVRAKLRQIDIRKLSVNLTTPVLEATGMR